MRSTDPGALEVNERYAIFANLKCDKETTPPPPPRLTFKVGDAFPTFAKVKEQIDLYSSQNHDPMSICDSRTLKSAI